MHFEKPPTRRIKATLNQLLLFFSIFFATLVACIVIFVLFFFKGMHLVSPMQGEQHRDIDALLTQTKTLCAQDHLSCSPIEAFGENAIHIVLANNVEVVLSTAKDIGQQLASLQAVTSQLTIKGKQLKKLDFRFDHLVVTY